MEICKKGGKSRAMKPKEIRVKPEKKPIKENGLHSLQDEGIPRSGDIRNWIQLPMKE